LRHSLEGIVMARLMRNFKLTNPNRNLNPNNNNNNNNNTTIYEAP